MSSLQGKVAIITGSSRGIGRAIAERLGRDGANVVITYAGNRDKAEEVVRAIEAGGSQAIAIQLDVRNLEEVRALFEKTTQHFGKVDILVNNAAGKNIFKPTSQMSEDEYNSMFDITRGVYFTLQQAAHHLADGGRIVSISTSGTAMAIPAGGAYAGCKAAIEHFSAALAKEVGTRGITVNTVSPGVTDTDGLVLDQEQVNQLIAQTPLGRLGHPDDVASAVAMLVSDDAHWVTGQSLRANGGIV
ncbi:MAG: SDR family oxidoreductase [Brasilonema octagenarum HA4186-MV1]|jgi:3-oxoacyl-[acyl-carrier protein] reductase|uniref:3-ketoacyl-ACP reductase n=1 Tax=Brasilonema sennae CENA114 TaxID=415709 RepID=A0A856MRJ0_9CYAN|nr:SDR family oxidoreductase [Brasilonema sennae]MBW4629272.1 SDR family oxidoreductase [Brasilonema octagenarum HA4186-MV1]QDL11736.1 3-ketoacyl-ACP reductase [Brasilonema sennae CENA114]QDL18117.1 3-ketoacyl-ACP reductase [Brasilonema octagenarum UFV-E1]